MTPEQRQVDPAAVAEGYRRHISRGRARLAEVTGGLVEVASKGVHVWDAHGRRYIDCGGYGVFLLGHQHPKVVQAVGTQLRRHALATRILLEPVAARAAEALAAVAPAGLEYVHFVNSGAEATEAAIKLARAHGKRHLISTAGGYHGKTMGALSLTARELYQAPFRPLVPDVQHVPYGDADALEQALAATPDACVVLEPVQGENGVVIPPSGYLTAVQRACRTHGALLVLDEVQTGLGRLGTWWGADREGITPDILLVGKNLSGGVIPVAAMVATAEAYAPFSRDPFIHTSTFAGSPVACAAAAAAVETIAAEGLVERAARIGTRLRDDLSAMLHEVCPHLVREVRGAGLLIAVELVDEGVAGDLVMELMDCGVLVNHSLNAHRVLRLTPPAVIGRNDIGALLDAVHRAATAVAARHPEPQPQPQLAERTA
ncbi:aspartate aminotransferase family protein [Streptomyces sp. Ag109_G2-15]|uniref:aspartate aminotransferase family protein n=1 Tax=Streptomyces sp. Ag109_G2-15 TaxID=1938850 RepID=UPI000BCBF867|nr:aminotransferase class III-fold pyridoxal phosphate-dependent enzyme [Streptomyces sp. Ag109_G2-15]SOE07560.1 acetylornithine aminotransferase apoenzyme [Streptomyces sp. Ag109_G2-15]